MYAVDKTNVTGTTNAKMRVIQATTGSEQQRAGGIEIVETEEECRDLLCRLKRVSGVFGIDCETFGVEPGAESPVGKGHIFCWSLAYADPSLGTNRRGGPLGRRIFMGGGTLAPMRAWLEDPAVQKVGHSCWAYDRHLFYNHGIKVQGIIADTLRVSRLLNASSTASHGLKDRMKDLFGYEAGSFKELFSRRVCLGVEDNGPAVYRARTVDGNKLRALVGGPTSRVGAGSELIDLSNIQSEYPEKVPGLYEYASLDAKAAIELYYELRKHAERTEWRGLGGQHWGSVWQFYEQIWNPFLGVLWDIERAGIGYDPGATATGKRLAAANCERLLESIRGWTGDAEFNPASPKQLTGWLYGALGYPVPPIEGTEVSNLKKVKPGKLPTSRMSLAWLKAQGYKSQGLDDLLEWKKESRQLQFLEALPGHLRGSRIHSILQPEAETGRLTSKTPNLQQCPKRYDPYKIRSGFVAGVDSLFACSDYSQLEMVVLAHFLIELFDDHTLANDIASGDVHTAAAQRLGLSRDIAKNIGYGISYCKGAMGLGLSLGISTQEAQEYLDAHDRSYPGVKKFQQHCFEMAKRTGVVRTLAGRTRPLPWARSDIRREVAAAARQAANTPIQGSAADIVVSAMLKLRKELPSQARMVLQIHDEIIVEFPEAMVDTVVPCIKHCMENPFKAQLLKVPLHVETYIGKSWYHAV